jgi:hypothetical protein
VRLTFRPPAGWTERRLGDVVHLVQPGRFASPWITGSPVVGVADFDATAAIEQDRPANSTIRYLQVVEDPSLCTVDGWPMKLAMLEVVGPAGDVVEIRLAAVYQLVYFTAVAVARGKDAELWEQARPVLLDILRSARPHLWPSAPSTIAELWTMDDP